MATNKLKRGRQGLNKLNLRIDSFTVSYHTAEASLTSLVMRAVLGGTLDTARVRRATKAHAKRMLDDLDARGVPNGAKLVEDAYRLGVRLAAEEHVVLGSIDSQALRLLQDNLKTRLGDATTHVGRRVDDIFRKEALRIAAGSLGDIEAASPANEYQRRLVQQGISAFTDKNGRVWGLADYARMAVKTTTSEAVFQGTVATMISKNLDVVEVNSVANPCERCKRYDGGTFSLTGRAKEYPLLDIIFPIHPNCQHYVVPGRAAFDERRAAA